MQTWHWQTWHNLPYLTCDLLRPFAHGFFTQQFAPKLPHELTPVLEPDAQPFRVKQVHGNTVLTPSEIANPRHADPTPESEDRPLPPADGVVTEQTAQAAWVCTADCVPALIADVATGQVAAVHAGWRGTAAKIVPRAIARLQDQGSALANLRVALGPAIAGDVYQVSTAVAAEVGATVVETPTPTDLHNRSEVDIAAILDQLRQLPQSPITEDPQPGRVRLDVRQVNLLQLKQLGLDPEQIAIAPYCTYQHPDHFFSYRRHRLKKVQWSGIVSQ